MVITSRRLPHHILVVRLSAMGDVAMLPHALAAFRAAYPEVKVTVATRPQFKPFFEGLGVEFLPVDVRNRYHGLKGMLALAREVRALDIDAFADAHDVLRSFVLRMVLRLHGIRTARIRKRHLHKWWTVRHFDHKHTNLKHTVVRYCDVLRRFGFDFADPKPPVKIDRPDPMPEIKGVRIGFAPFSAHRGKTYPEASARRAVELLSARFDHVFIHGGGGAEADFAKQMESLYPNVTALHGRLSGLDEEINLISNLDCVVSMDSLVMHLASLTATPLVSVWGATHPSVGFFGYGCDPQGILQADMKCRPCSVYGNKKCRYGDYRCLDAITPEMIVDKVEEMIRKYR
ncbi:MAG: glycosyltransferase family 9 protein [Alistipes sp.]|nr:glycosyltransferase family 9 protein [Alistipes sp.]